MKALLTKILLLRKDVLKKLKSFLLKRGKNLLFSLILELSELVTICICNNERDLSTHTKTGCVTQLKKLFTPFLEVTQIAFRFRVDEIIKH